MSKLTFEQKLKGQAYGAKALAVAHDQEKFDAVMQEFEEWKKSEGIKI